MRAVIVAMCALAAACAGGPEKRAGPTFAETKDPECYTVDLFTETEVRTPPDDVPEPWRAFAGRWGGGAWAGVWCHDLHVLEVAPDGTVDLIETHAPHKPWGKPATAYRRTAKIGEDGHLRFNYGRVRLEYWVEDDTLYGLRRVGPTRAMKIALSPKA